MQEQLKEKIAELDKRIEALTKERNSLRQQYAEGQTDLKIGDRVKKEDGTDVWQLTAIRPASYGNEPKFFGRKIKKDGTPGAVIHEIWVGYNKKLVRANDLGNRRDAGPIGGASVLTDELCGNGSEVGAGDTAKGRK